MSGDQPTLRASSWSARSSVAAAYEQAKGSCKALAGYTVPPPELRQAKGARSNPGPLPLSRFLSRFQLRSHGLGHGSEFTGVTLRHRLMARIAFVDEAIVTINSTRSFLVIIGCF